ncbi:hypothetical protein ACVGVM_23515 [Pseudonocardia bannensis]|uniref:Lipoprotein LpqN n=1 Tax=Pseudonocardia bannensis TaxID=630973 RepID=A0A848DLZ5_9PSEU|nr:hypothetical protein [Pseudonocardia bannensis]NMH93404.1 hypothetical protein [Pseudonocardia bannensis]
MARFPAAVRVGTALDGPVAGVPVRQTVSVYGDEGTARAAHQANADGPACSEGTLSGQPVVITPAEDLQFDVGGEQATGWRVGGESFDVVLISVQTRELVVNFTYLSPAGAPTGLPDPLVISRTGVQKLAG